MTRRAFIAGLGCAAALPLVARAQHPEQVHRVGYLSPASATELTIALFNTFRHKLNELGYAEGRNLIIDVRRADGDFSRLPALAADLVSLAPEVIVGTSTPAIQALQRATSSIPIVMGSDADPIGSGFVRTLAQPGGNITGPSAQTVEFTAKSLELLHTAVPEAKRIGVLMSPSPHHAAAVNNTDTASKALALTLVPVIAPTSADFDGAFATMRKQHCDALLVLSDPRVNRRVVELAETFSLPAMYQASGFVEMGGLMSYSADLTESFQLAAIYVDKVLRGARPSDLPVEQPKR